jgi:hypothetical protein
MRNEHQNKSLHCFKAALVINLMKECQYGR